MGRRGGQWFWWTILSWLYNFQCFLGVGFTRTWGRRGKGRGITGDRDASCQCGGCDRSRPNVPEENMGSRSRTIHPPLPQFETQATLQWPQKGAPLEKIAPLWRFRWTMGYVRKHCDPATTRRKANVKFVSLSFWSVLSLLCLAIFDTHRTWYFYATINALAPPPASSQHPRETLRLSVLLQSVSNFQKDLSAIRILLIFLSGPWWRKTPQVSLNAFNLSSPIFSSVLKS